MDASLFYSGPSRIRMNLTEGIIEDFNVFEDIPDGEMSDDENVQNPRKIFLSLIRRNSACLSLIFIESVENSSLRPK